MATGSQRAVVAALVGNGLIAIAKFVTAILTGSKAMLSEAYHSVADTGNQALLLWGFRQAKQGPSPEHPFGRGKETYFWSFMVAVILFVGGAVLSFEHGIEALRDPHELGNLLPNYLVLGVAIVIEAFAFRVALKEFNRTRGTRSIWRAFRASKDTAVIVVLLEDSAAMTGLLVALGGLLMVEATGDPRWDGIASLVIGVILATVAILLARETKALLIGEAANRADRAGIRTAILTIPEVESIGRILTMQLGPDDVLVNIEVEIADGLDTDRIEAIVRRIEEAIRSVLPQARNVFVELAPPGGHRSTEAAGHHDG